MEVRKRFWAEFEGRVSQEERHGMSKLFSLEGEAWRNLVYEEDLGNLTVTFFGVFGKHERVH